MMAWCDDKAVQTLLSFPLVYNFHQCLYISISFNHLHNHSMYVLVIHCELSAKSGEV